MWLAASNTITANVFGVASNGSDDEVTTNVSTGVVYLGHANVIIAPTIEVAYNNLRSSMSGTLQFAPGNVNPTLAVYGAGGPGNRAEIDVGFIVASSYDQYATGTFDLVTGVTGTSVLTGYVDQMILGYHNYSNNSHPASGTFNMGGGTLDANTIIVGDMSVGTIGTASASGTFSLNGGTVLAGSITLAASSAIAGSSSGTFNLNSGLVSASAIASGPGSAAFNWTSGTIANYDPVYGLGGDAAESNLSISVPTLTLASTGTHDFWIDSGYTGSVSSTISGNGAVANVGPGTLILSGTNTFEGGLNVLDGTVILTDNEAIAEGTSLTVGNASALSAFVAEAAIASAAPASALPAPVPEPGTPVILAAMLAGAAVYRRMRRKSR